MFDIEYKGANALIISTKKTKIVVDPKLSIVGLNNISTTGSVELATDSRLATYSSDAIISIDGPGEYGIGEFDIFGISAQRHIDDDKSPLACTIYRIEIGDVRVGLIGNIDSKLSDEQLERLGVIDILIIPVGGGGYTLDGVDAASLVKLIEPKVVIPTHYYDEKIKYEVAQDKLELFTTELGANVEEQRIFKYKTPFSYPESLLICKIARS